MKALIRSLVLVALISAAFVANPVNAEGPADANPCLVASTAGCSYGLPTVQYELLLTQMMAHPSPDVREIDIDPREVKQYNYYKINKDGTAVYNAPGGAQVGSIDPGFNFVNPIQFQGDWAEINPGQWIPTNQLSAVPASFYRGVVMDRLLAYPMAWVLQPTKPSAIPGQKAEKGTPAVNRYTRVNIFATVKIDKWEWYLIGPGQWIEQRRVGRVLPVTKPAGVKGRWISVNLYEQVLVAYDEDMPVFATLISSGLPKWDTNEGLFHIWARVRNDTMSGAMGRPDFYVVPDVPWVMYFDKDISLHGTYWHDGFGYRHSHGCVNLSITDARWLFQWTNNFYSDTFVYVWASGKYEDRIGG